MSLKSTQPDPDTPDQGMSSLHSQDCVGNINERRGVTKSMEGFQEASELIHYE